MGRKQTVNYTALEVKIYDSNVTIETYINLFKDLKNNHREIPLSRDNYLHLTYVKPINDENPKNGFIGEIFKRNSLPSDWYNTTDGTRNTKEDVESKYLPKDLKAKVRFFKFAFYPSQKKIICEIDHSFNKISENVIEEFFKELLGTDELKKKFKRIEVNLVSEKITPERIIQTPQITQLELLINYYSEGIKKDSSALEKEILKEMEDTNIRTYSRMLTAEKTKFLKFNDKIKELIHIAFEYGHINYKYKNNDDRTEDKSSSDDASFIKRVTYDTKTENLTDLFLRETLKISQQLK